ncbi:MAG: cellulase family glycosylhydrolase [bacterium]
MNRNLVTFLLCCVFTLIQSVNGQFSHFITAAGDKLMDGDWELRFISYNIPNLHYIEDHQAFDDPNPWRVANEFEIRDALNAIKQSGGMVTRLYTPSIRKANDDPRIIRHVEGPGQFNEEAFKAYDKILQIANEVGVRVIIPLIDNWWWWGGVTDYGRLRGKPREAFWTDSVVIADFKKTIAFMVNRVNTYTGLPFKDDKALLGWETGNELDVPTFAWTREIAAYIKSLDTNHLVIEGTHSQSILDEALADPNIDILSTHHYRPAYQTITLMLTAREKAKGKKPYFVGEFGFMPADSMRLVLDAVISSGISGIMVWSMRGHNRDGGYYYHTDAYRWPGFESGQRWEEQKIIQLFTEKAYAINGLPVAPLPIPAAPTILPITTPYKISWQGSTGASSYLVERKDRFLLFFSRWSVIDSNASDANVRYRPLFSDTTAEPGVSYSYRIRAKNTSGISEASAVAGPIEAPYRILIDEFENDKLMVEKSSGVSFIRNKDAAKAKEDQYRLEGKRSDYILYRLSEEATVLQLDVFITTTNRDSSITFFSGASPETPSSLSVKYEIFEPFKNEYKAFIPMRYSIVNIPPDHRFIKIHLMDGIQLSRLEIGYDPD